jgi:MoxR-like ATPase
MQTIAVGKPLIEFFLLCYGAGLSILLHGKHGLGKSEIAAQAARAIGIEFIALDLSIMEAPDLTGIPRITREGRTEYAPPDFLPKPGTNGILLIEELNRSPRHLQAPCLQLLTARRLNSYQLPTGWLVCAAINDVEDGYFADELDRALLSRFVNVTVGADVVEWVSWARQAEIHPKIIDFVQCSPGIFDDPSANPRAWEYASKFLKQSESSEERQSFLPLGLAGLLGDKWALAFLRFYKDQRRPLRPAEIIEAYPANRAAFRCWVAQRHMDVVAASVDLLKKHLQAQRVYELVVSNASHKTNVEGFFADVPPDFQRQIREWLEQRGFQNLTVPARSKGGKP